MLVVLAIILSFFSSFTLSFVPTTGTLQLQRPAAIITGRLLSSSNPPNSNTNYELPELPAIPNNLPPLTKEYYSGVYSLVKEIYTSYPPGSLSRIIEWISNGVYSSSTPGVVDDVILDDGYVETSEDLPGLERRKWWDDRQKLQWVEALESRSEDIIQEFASVAKEGKTLWSTSDRASREVMGPGWSSLRLMRHGNWLTSTGITGEIFERTRRAVTESGAPLSVRNVLFARQAGGGQGIREHTDGRNFILTAHLGVKVPSTKTGECESDQLYLSVGGERRRWEEGKCLVFSTSYLHSTWNDSDGDRVVLLVDFWHPDVTEVEREFLRRVYEMKREFRERDSKRGEEEEEEDNVQERLNNNFFNFFAKR